MNELVDGQWQPGTWADFEQWRCVICQWDTLRGLEAAREHAANCPRCHPPLERPSPTIVVADKRGHIKEDPR
jgi:alpha-amylase/alpha-mannosidase (GH57 family)